MNKHSLPESPFMCPYRGMFGTHTPVCAHPAFNGKYPLVLICNTRSFPTGCPLVIVEEEGE